MLPHPAPACPTLSAAVVPHHRLVCLALSLSVLLGCSSGATGPDLPKLEVIASDNPEAEADLRAARAVEERGDIEEARQRYRAFLDVWPNDPAAPLAALSLGRIALSQGELETAQRRFDQVAESKNVALAEKGRLYGAVTQQRAGHNAEALSVLEPMVGRTVDPGETALLLYTIADAQEERGDFLAALRTRDRMLEGALEIKDRQNTEASVAKLVNQLDPELVLPQAYESLPRDGFAWPLVAKRWLIESYQRSETATVVRVGHDLDAQGVPLDEHLRELIVRAQRRDSADTRVLGAILPLSGRGQEVGQSAMRGLMLAAGLPSDAPPGPESFRVVFRDGEGDPQRSADAVEDLASLHRAIGVIGPVARPAALAAAERANDLGVPMISLSPARDLTDAGDRIYRLLPGPDEEALALVTHAKAYGARRVAVLHPDNGYGEAMVQATAAAAASLGCELVGTRAYPAGATSFGKDVEALSKLSPEAILIADSAQQVSLIAPALAAGGLWSMLPGSAIPDGEHALFLLPSSAFSSELAQTSRRYLQGAVFSVPFDTERGAAAEFADRYRAEFGEEPNVFAAYAYDAYRLFVSAVNEGGSTRTDIAANLQTVRLGDPVGPTAGFTAARGPLGGVRLEMLVGGAFSPVAAARPSARAGAGH